MAIGRQRTTEYTLSLPEGNLKLTIFPEGFAEGERRDGTREEAVVTGISGRPIFVTVPDATPEGVPIVALERKAFLSKKSLKSVSLPGTIRRVGDWAFAYCDSLEQVIFRETKPENHRVHDGGINAGGTNGRGSVFERAVFLECNRLQELKLPGISEDAAHLLAAVISDPECSYLLDPTLYGTAEWMKRWDARLVTLLGRGDQEGFSKQILCGEEDYGSTDLGAYMAGSRRKKCAFALLRHIYREGLPEKLHEELSSFLLEHPEDTWDMLLQSHGEDRIWYEAYLQLGGAKASDKDLLLQRIGDRYPEMKAVVLQYLMEPAGVIFAGLGL